MNTKLKKFKDAMYDAIEEIYPNWFLGYYDLADFIYKEHDDFEVIIRTMMSQYGYEYTIKALNEILNTAYSIYYYSVSLVLSENKVSDVYKLIENTEDYIIIRGIKIDEYRCDYEDNVNSYFISTGNILVKPIKTIETEFIVDMIVLGEFPTAKGHYLYDLN